MKNILYILTTLFILTSCEIEMSDNGDLDGLWQMTEMQQTGKNVIDMCSTGTIWGFQFRLLELRSKSNQNGFLCRFEQRDGHLKVFEPYAQKHDESDEPITDATILNPYGLYTLSEEFQIEAFTSSNMILKSDKVRLKFRKY